MTEDVFGIVGTLVGGAFNVETVVAEGGFAVVYRAYHGAFHAPVALKCLKVPAVTRISQQEFLERFREEGELLFRLSQSISSVVRPLHIDAFETAKGVFVPYMALEWLDGESLDVIIARRTEEGRPPMSVKRVIRMLAPVARALARAHRFPGPDGPVSIVHRDLKPDNIMVATINGEEVVKVLDFGIAKVRSVASQAAGRVSVESAGAAVPFTPGYASPEQWLPKRYGQTGPWTDVWGLALTVVEALSGKAAIDGDNTAMMGTAIDAARRPTPRAEGAIISDEVEDVFLKALAVDPRSRHQDVGEFWDALEAAAGLNRSAVPSSGSTPQPYRDPRAEGSIPPLFENVSPRRPSRRPVRPFMPSSDLDGSVRGNTPTRRFSVNMQVPDLDLGLPSEDLRRRPESSAKMRALQTADLKPVVPPASPARAVSQPGTEVELDLEQARLSTAEEATAVPALVQESRNTPHSIPAPPKETEERMLSDSGMGDSMAPDQASGLDLAVSPEEVRRASAANLRAVSVASLADSGMPPVSNRSGAYRALSSSVRAPSSHPGPQPPLSPPMPPPAPAPWIAPPIPSSIRRVIIPTLLIVVGMVLAIGFYVNASMGGGRWSLGPMPLNWVAGILVVSGLAVLLLRVFWREE